LVSLGMAGTSFPTPICGPAIYLSAVSLRNEGRLTRVYAPRRRMKRWILLTRIGIQNRWRTISWMPSAIIQTRAGKRRQLRWKTGGQQQPSYGVKSG
jgi:hypothetical protein